MAPIIRARCFNSQPPEGGWFGLLGLHLRSPIVSTHSRPKAAGHPPNPPSQRPSVSTHSRPKAAGCIEATSSPPTKSFNSQPPEGGWAFCMSIESGAMRVSTHSRPKAAGQASAKLTELKKVSTHSRPKAAGCGIAPISAGIPRFNSQPPEGGWRICQGIGAETGSFNSQPPEGGWNNSF